MKEIPELKRIIEAALLASAQPLTLPQISGLFDELEMPPHDDLARALGELQDDCAERGVELVEVASGFRYQVRQDVHAFVSRLWSERASRYSRALLETLSLIAYRQPITRAEIEQIRGVAVSTNIVRTLEEREWVRVVGYRDLPGKPALFGTTKQFLDYFNLKSLDELPPLSELRDIEEMDPQLEFDADRRVIAAIAGLPEDEAAEESENDDRSDATVTDIESMPAPATHAEDTFESSSAAANDAKALSSSSTDAEHSTGAAENDAPESVT
ncbi:MAG: SMC-Scp complex subunit ScpB [Dokdonella sp.]